MGVTVTSCGWSPRLLTDLLGALFRNGYVCTICVHRCAREGARLPSALLKQKHALPRPAEFPMLTCLRRNYRAVDLKLKKGELSSRRFCLWCARYHVFNFLFLQKWPNLFVQSKSSCLVWRVWGSQKWRHGRFPPRMLRTIGLSKIVAPTSSLSRSSMWREHWEVF